MKFSKREAIIESWVKLKSELLLWITIMLFILVINVIISAIQEKLLEDINFQSVLFIIAAYLFQAGINLGTLKIALNIHNKIETGFDQIFNQFHLLFSFIISTIVFLVLVIISAGPGILLLLMSISSDYSFSPSADSISSPTYVFSLILILAPAIYSSIRLQLYDYFLVDAGYGPVEAIKASFACTKGLVGELFIIGSVLSIIILISMIPLMLGLLISVPLATMVNAKLYIILSSRIKSKLLYSTENN